MTIKEKYRLRKEQGLCTRCGKDRGNSTTLLCETCKEYYKGDRLLKIQMKICPVCGKNPIRGTERTCFECLDKTRVQQKEYRDKNREVLNAKKRDYNKKRTVNLREQGFCTKCGRRKATGGFLTCPICRQKATYYGKMRYARKNEQRI